jgi:hypothetical protein
MQFFDSSYSVYCRLPQNAIHPGFISSSEAFCARKYKIRLQQGLNTVSRICEATIQSPPRTDLF